MTEVTREEQKTKLNALVKVLEKRGVVDIKFDFVEGSCFDDLLRDTIDVLQAIVDKRHTLAKSLGDSVRFPNCS